MCRPRLGSPAPAAARPRAAGRACTALAPGLPRRKGAAAVCRPAEAAPEPQGPAALNGRHRAQKAAALGGHGQAPGLWAVLGVLARLGHLASTGRRRAAPALGRIAGACKPASRAGTARSHNARHPCIIPVCQVLSAPPPPPRLEAKAGHRKQPASSPSVQGLSARSLRILRMRHGRAWPPSAPLHCRRLPHRRRRRRRCGVGKPSPGHAQGFPCGALTQSDLPRAASIYPPRRGPLPRPFSTPPRHLPRQGGPSLAPPPRPPLPPTSRPPLP